MKRNILAALVVAAALPLAMVSTASATVRHIEIVSDNGLSPLNGAWSANGGENAVVWTRPTNQTQGSEEWSIIDDYYCTIGGVPSDKIGDGVSTGCKLFYGGGLNTKYAGDTIELMKSDASNSWCAWGLSNGDIKITQNCESRFSTLWVRVPDPGSSGYWIYVNVYVTNYFSNGNDFHATAGNCGSDNNAPMVIYGDGSTCENSYRNGAFQ